MSGRSKLNTIPSKIFEALIKNLTSHEDFGQRSDTEKNNLIEKDKIKSIDEIIRQNV